ncbi:hypothetical protein ES705_32403 [subsurface metagenome]
MVRLTSEDGGGTSGAFSLIMSPIMPKPFHHPIIILLQLFHTGNPGKPEIGQVRGDLAVPDARAGAWGRPIWRSLGNVPHGRPRAGPARGDRRGQLSPDRGAAPGGRRCRRHVAAGCDRRGRLEIPVDQAVRPCTCRTCSPWTGARSLTHAPVRAARPRARAQPDAIAFAGECAVRAIAGEGPR